MRDAGDAVERFGFQLPRQIVELALGPAANEMAVVDRADAGGIISAIFEPLEPVEQPPRDLGLPDDTDNSAHLPGRSFEQLCRRAMQH
jgi:hypothetical protein